ncbi:helix-turn-helix domain-containing protein [Streptomyces sp. NPDC002580]|uniref:helix-turn-helix domain-containing protein n=1 Tax=Streptomyces sp. NPDC002580 TaxID=3364653 RepID=UPI0036745783
MAGLFRRIVGKVFPSRQAPARATTQASHVREKQYGGSTKEMARAFGVTERTVQRWIKGTRTPKGEDAKKLETAAAAAQVTDRGRERRAKQMEKEPAGTIRVRVDRAGTFSVRGSDAVRTRTVDLDLKPDQAAALARATDDAGVRDVIGDALADYFNGGAYGGFRASDFDFDADGVDLS